MPDQITENLLYSYSLQEMKVRAFVLPVAQVLGQNEFFPAGQGIVGRAVVRCARSRE